MGLHLFSVHHDDHGLAAVERVAPAVPGLGPRLVQSSGAVRGAVVLSTCNRVEMYLDADSSVDPGGLAHQVRQVLADALTEHGQATRADELSLTARHHTEVLWHLFGVGAGLDSMVVGEREISGQLRRALKVAHREHTANYVLTESIEQALHTSRRVAHLTGLASTGRSVVSVGLDLVTERGDLGDPAGRGLAGAAVLLVGTGAYAGATVAALRARGVRNVAVYSASGRAERFAAGHHVTAVPAEGFADALVAADLVVTCRGFGSPLLTVEAVTAALAGRGGRPLALLDLALNRDVAMGVADLTGVTVVDLLAIQKAVPEVAVHQVTQAQEIVAEGVHDLVTTLDGRQMDPAVVALRDTTLTMVEDEIERLPKGRPLTHEDAAHALRRLAARLVHVPSVRARKAAEEGRAEQYLAALTELYGIHARPAEHAVFPSAVNRNLEIGTDPQPGPAPGVRPPEVVDPAELDTGVCPVTGLSLRDLRAAQLDQEAM